tara:strand:+ start:6800 stop:7426 length:627 start_codon:yes stop_codon:yes gene_type:complete
MALDDNDKVVIGTMIDTSVKKLTDSLGDTIGKHVAPLLKPITERLDKTDETVKALGDAETPPKPTGKEGEETETPKYMTAEQMNELLDKREEERRKKDAETKNAHEATKKWLKANGFGKVVGGPYEERFKQCTTDEQREAVLETINNELKSVGGKPIEKADPSKDESTDRKLTLDERNKLTPQERIKRDIEAENAANQKETVGSGQPD